MSFSLLQERAHALSSDFGSYVARHLPYAQALSTTLGAHPSYAGLMAYLASFAPSGIYPYLFEERSIKNAQGGRHLDYQCRLFHASLSPSPGAIKTTSKTLHVLHVLDTLLKSCIADGTLTFRGDDERDYAQQDEIRRPPEADYMQEDVQAPMMRGRPVKKFLWPLYEDGALRVKVITNAFCITPFTPSSRALDQETLTCLMLCALAHRLSLTSGASASESGSVSDNHPDVLFSFSVPAANYKAMRTVRGVRVALYAGANDPQHSARCAMRALFARHKVDDPEFLFFATLLAQGAFSDVSKPEVVNATGLDHYVFSPCHLHLGRNKTFKVIGMVIGLKNGMITHGQGGILSGSEAKGLTLSSHPDWIIGELPPHLSPLLYNSIGHGAGLPDTDSLIADVINFEKGGADDAMASHHESSDETYEPSTYGGSAIRTLSVNFLAHPHPIFAGFALSDAYFGDGLCPNLKGKDNEIKTYSIRDLDRFSSSASSSVLLEHGNAEHPIVKPLLMSLNRRGVNMRRISFLLHEMLTRDNPHVALYKTLRNGMICKNSLSYNICISLLSLEGAQDAQKRIIQFAQLYPALFAWILERLSGSQAHVINNVVTYDPTCDVTKKQLDAEDLTFFCRRYEENLEDAENGFPPTPMRTKRARLVKQAYRSDKTPLNRCALGIMRDVVCGRPIEDSLRRLLAAATGLDPRDISRKLVKCLTQCKVRSKEYQAVRRLMVFPNGRSFLHISRFLEINPDLTLTQYLEADKVLMAATDIIRSASLHKGRLELYIKRMMRNRSFAIIFSRYGYEEGGYCEHYTCNNQRMTPDTTLCALNETIALSQRILLSFTKKTLDHFKRWTCADILEVAQTVFTLAHPSLESYPDTPEVYTKTDMSENFLRLHSEQHLVHDLLALCILGHDRAEVLQHVSKSVERFRLYRPRGVSKDPIRDTWPVLCPPETHNGVTLTCIESQSRLEEEGRNMAHCVGGYTQWAWSGEPILSLTSSSARTTAHLHVEEGHTLDINGVLVPHYSLTISQHRGYYNGQAAANHKSALKKFIEVHNADQKGLGALFASIAKKNKAVRDYRSNKHARQHHEEHGTALALHWPQFSFFMRKKCACPYPIVSADTFKALYKKRIRRERSSGVRH